MSDLQQFVELELRTDGVAEIILNRPEKRNAFDDEVIRQLLQAIAEVRSNKEIRALLLSSRGEHFSAGADLGWMQRMVNNSEQQNLEDARELGQLMQQLDQLEIPVVTLAQGSSFGGALGLLACSDVVIATDASLFCLSEVKIGLIPAVISPFVSRAIGARQARRYMVTAEMIDAATALQIGLIHETVSDETALRERGEKLLKQLCNNSPAAMIASKQLAKYVADAPLTEALFEETAKRIARIRVSEEGQEGLNSFLQKRKPGWISGAK